MTSFLIKTSCLNTLEKDSCGFSFKCISFYLGLPKEDMTLSLMSQYNLAYVKGQWSVIHILLLHHLLSLHLLPLPLSLFLFFLQSNSYFIRAKCCSTKRRRTSHEPNWNLGPLGWSAWRQTERWDSPIHNSKQKDKRRWAENIASQQSKCEVDRTRQVHSLQH